MARTPQKTELRRIGFVQIVERIRLTRQNSVQGNHAISILADAINYKNLDQLTHLVRELRTRFKWITTRHTDQYDLVIQNLARLVGLTVKLYFVGPADPPPKEQNQCIVCTLVIFGNKINCDVCNSQLPIIDVHMQVLVVPDRHVQFADSVAAVSTQPQSEVEQLLQQVQQLQLQQPPQQQQQQQLQQLQQPQQQQQLQQQQQPQQQQQLQQQQQQQQQQMQQLQQQQQMQQLQLQQLQLQQQMQQLQQQGNPKPNLDLITAAAMRKPSKQGMPSYSGNKPDEMNLSELQAEERRLKMINPLSSADQARLFHVQARIKTMLTPQIPGVQLGVQAVYPLQPQILGGYPFQFAALPYPFGFP